MRKKVFQIGLAAVFLLVVDAVLIAQTSQNPNGDPHNPCHVTGSSSICLGSGAVSLQPPANSPLASCAESEITLTAVIIASIGQVQVTTTFDYCPPDIKTNPAPPTVVSNWWVASGPGGFTTNGTGLTATFTPTNCGGGTVTFSCQYTNESPCTGSGVATTTGNFQITQVKVKKEPDVEFLCKGCSMVLTADVCPSGGSYTWKIEWDGTDGASISSTSGSSITLSVPVTAANGLVTILLKDNTSGCLTREYINVWGSQNFPPRRSDNYTEAEQAWKRAHLICALDNMNVAEEVSAEVRRLFPNPACRADSTIGNAFQHAYLMCLVAQRCGTATANDLGDAHEAYRENDCSRGGPQMDLHNNEVGIHCGAAGGDCSQNVLNALRNGQLRWLEPLPTADCVFQFQSDVLNNNCMPTP